MQKKDNYKIVADENIPFVNEFFGKLGNVNTFSAREISNDVVKDADVLLVRSVTKVNELLLKNSNVKFVGTATIGVDHVDQEYLKKSDIFFTNSAGSNANSVAEYVFASLLVLADRNNMCMRDKSIGIIGVGNIGKLVEAKARALGMDVLLNDPPLARETGSSKYLPLEQVLSADIVTCHVPLTKDGLDKTYHLISEKELEILGDDSIFINSSRGPVVCNNSLLEWLKKAKNSYAVLDVWENEPTPNLELLKLSSIASPHIAGYSFDGKVNGTRMLYEALCGEIGCQTDVNQGEFMPLPEIKSLDIDLEIFSSPEQALAYAVKAIYDIEADDSNMREILSQKNEDIGPFFDKLRKTYPRRREASNTVIRLVGQSSSESSFKGLLGGFGFVLE